MYGPDVEHAKKERLEEKVKEEQRERARDGGNYGIINPERGTEWIPYRAPDPEDSPSGPIQYYD